MPARFYDQGTRPRVFINWQSFERWGFPSSWKGPFTDAVINAYTRWMQVAGVDLRFQFWNYTANTTANPGEILIQMNETFTGSTRLASTFGTYGQLTIIFHRKNGMDLTPWNFVPYNAAEGEFDMQGILMHELGRRNSDTTRLSPASGACTMPRTDCDRGEHHDSQRQRRRSIYRRANAVPTFPHSIHQSHP